MIRMPSTGRNGREGGEGKNLQRPSNVLQSVILRKPRYQTHVRPTTGSKTTYLLQWGSAADAPRGTAI